MQLGKDSISVLLPHRQGASLAFRLYMLVVVVLDFTTQMAAVAISWQMYRLTGSAFDLGLIGLIQFAPVLLLTFIVGYAADRWNRKGIVGCALAAQAVLFAWLATASGLGWVSQMTLFGAVVVLGVSGAFLDAAMPALLSSLVAPEQLSQQMAKVTSISQMAVMVGPAVGGVLYALGANVVYGTAAVGCCIAALLMLAISAHKQQPTDDEPISLRSVLAGLTFIRSRPVVLGAISLDLFAVLFGGVTALLPIYANTILHIGATGLGVLWAAPAIGATLMSIALTWRPIRQRVGPMLFFSVLIFGCATIVFAASKSLALSIAALIILGASDVISMVIRSTLVMTQTPDSMRGRVNAVNQVFIGTSNQIGAFESGLTASWFGAIPAAVLGGLATIAVVLLWSRLFPTLFRADEFSEEGLVG
ncbi:hypothetical protein SD51_01765 [Alicyclobacillus tengchongensis]|nr:hypothetical protein SD51_01765 [Alicyclobacillus tengchongensis]